MQNDEIYHHTSIQDDRTHQNLDPPIASNLGRIPKIAMLMPMLSQLFNGWNGVPVNQDDIRYIYIFVSIFVLYIYIIYIINIHITYNIYIILNCMYFVLVKSPTGRNFYIGPHLVATNTLSRRKRFRPGLKGFGAVFGREQMEKGNSWLEIKDVKDLESYWCVKNVGLLDG